MMLITVIDQLDPVCRHYTYFFRDIDLETLASVSYKSNTRKNVCHNSNALHEIH